VHVHPQGEKKIFWRNFRGHKKSISHFSRKFLMGGERWRVEVVNLACVLRATTKQTKKNK